MSERRKQAYWIQNILHNPRVSFIVNNITFEGTARIVDQNNESILAAEVSKLMSAKYGWNKGFRYKTNLAQVMNINNTL